MRKVHDSQKCECASRQNAEHKGFRFVSKLPRWTGKNFLQVHVSSWDQLEIIKEIFDSPSWVFRGQAMSSWGLDSSLDRIIKSGKNITVAVERKVINAFRTVAETGIKGSRAIDTLAHMQHYGAPTRLLDFTKAWNVALWFAFDKELRTRYRSVWALNLETAVEKSNILDSDIEAEASQIAMDQKLGHEDFVAIKGLLRDGIFWERSGFSDRVKSLADRVLSGGIKKGVGILPIVWDGDRCNKRMKAQCGIFVMPLGLNGFAKNLEDALSLGLVCKLTIKEFKSAMKHSGIDLVKVIIDNSCRAQILAVLAKSGISMNTIYPDLTDEARQ